MKENEVVGLVICSIIMFIVFLLLAYIFIPFEDIIWKNKGRVFRIRKKDKYWVVEKKFLCFFVRNDLFGLSQFLKTKEEAIKKLSEYIQELDEVQNSEYIIDYTKFISDPKRLIGTKKLETKRITDNKRERR